MISGKINMISISWFDIEKYISGSRWLDLSLVYKTNASKFSFRSFKSYRGDKLWHPKSLFLFKLRSGIVLSTFLIWKINVLRWFILYTTILFRSGWCLCIIFSDKFCINYLNFYVIIAEIIHRNPILIIVPDR